MAGAAPDLRFDLVVATVDRTAELETLLRSLDGQTHRPFASSSSTRTPTTAWPSSSPPTPRSTCSTSARHAASRARATRRCRTRRATLVAFPDDDCRYPPDLLERVARRFADDPELGGLTGRAVAADGSGDASWEAEPAVLDAQNLWNRVISFSIFLRRGLVERVGAFDERLGLGAGSPWSSGEEVEYVLRAIRTGARIEYDPSLTVTHARKEYSRPELRAMGLRDGASVGWILRRHRYGPRTVGRMLVRPARRDRRRTRCTATWAAPGSTLRRCAAAFAGYLGL